MKRRGEVILAVLIFLISITFISAFSISDYAKSTGEATDDGGSGPISGGGGGSSSSGLVAYYSFDDQTAKDSRGIYNGTLRNGVSFTEGKSGKAAYFDGVNDFIRVDKLKVTNNDSFSVSFWMKPEFNSNDLKDKGSLLWLEGAGNLVNPTFFTVLHLQNVSITYGAPFTSFLVNENNPLNGARFPLSFHNANYGEWDHIVVTYNKSSSTIALYDQGYKLSEKSVTKGIQNEGILWIGKVYADYFKGSIDEVRLYNKALSQNEIEALYNSIPPACIPLWACGGWSDCINGEQTRVCYDQNNCETNNNRPEDRKSCDNNYEILSEWQYIEGGNVIPVGSNNAKKIKYSMDVKEDDISKVEDSIDLLITTPSSNDLIVNFNKSDEYCDQYYGDYNTCSIYFEGGFDINEKGIYYITTKNDNKRFLAVGVEENFISDRLILDSKYNPGEPYAYYYDYDKTIRLSVDYELNNYEEIELEMQEFENEIDAQKYLDEIFNDINNEDTEVAFRIQPEKIEGNLVYLIGGESGGQGRFSVALWRSNNKVIILAYGSLFSNRDVSSEDLANALAGKISIFEDNIDLNDFPEPSQELIRGYLVKNPSSITGNEISCISDWQCTIVPFVCPEYGKQAKACIDKNDCKSSTETEVSCLPGICSGCFNVNDGKCIPYGFRLEDKYTENNLYCDIDGKLKTQKIKDDDGSWAKCQNNYECDSNLCSGGECVEINDAISQAKGFKGFFAKLSCRLAHVFNNDNYEACVVRFLGEETNPNEYNGIINEKYKIVLANFNGNDYSIWSEGGIYTQDNDKLNLNYYLCVSKEIIETNLLNAGEVKEVSFNGVTYQVRASDITSTSEADICVKIDNTEEKCYSELGKGREKIINAQNNHQLKIRKINYHSKEGSINSLEFSIESGVDSCLQYYFGDEKTIDEGVSLKVEDMTKEDYIKFVLKKN